jgi:hypothetical protein
MEFALTVLSDLQIEIKDMVGNILLSAHCYIHRQTGLQKDTPGFDEFLSHSVKVINYI